LKYLASYGTATANRPSGQLVPPDSPGNDRLDIFLDDEDRWKFLSLLEPFGESLVLPFQLLDLLHQLTLRIGFATPFPGGQAAEDPLFPLSTP
jgi:hypothetical protein